MISGRNVGELDGTHRSRCWSAGGAWAARAGLGAAGGRGRGRGSSVCRRAWPTAQAEPAGCASPICDTTVQRSDT